MVNVKVGGGDGGGGGQADAQQHNVEASRGDPPQHPIGFQLSGNSRGIRFVLVVTSPDPHCELVGGTNPDEVEVGKSPGKAKGETPTHHDTQVGEENHRDEA